MVIDIKLPDIYRASKNIDRKMASLIKNTNIPEWLKRGAIPRLFNLYLLKKYKNNCFKSASPLRFNLTDDETLNFQVYAKNIVECVKKGTDNIVMLVSIVFSHGEGRHANLLIYHKKQNIIEHFEPHGNIFQGSDEKGIDVKIMQRFNLFVQILNKTFKENGMDEVVFLPSNVICPTYMGLQYLEQMSSIEKTVWQGEGYCEAWSMFVAELALRNPQVTTVELLQLLYDKLNGMKISERKDYLRKVIVGYTNYIFETYDKYYKTLFSKKIQDMTDIEHKFARKDIDVLIDIYTDFASDPTLTKTKYVAELKNKLKQRKLKLQHQDIRTKILLLEKNVLYDASPLSRTPESLHSGRIAGVTDTTKKDTELKPCPPGQERNPVTKRCRKIAGVTRKVADTKKKDTDLKPCPPGQEHNPVTNRCRKNIDKPASTKRRIPEKTGLKPCKEGQIRNPATNRCKKI